MSDYNDFLLPEPCLRMNTHFGDEYESVEFGDGTGYVKAEPTLARLGALYVELDELRDENARLRSCLTDDVENARLIMAENAKLREDLEDQEAYDQMLRDRLRQQTELRVKAEAENAKLRELCVKALEWLRWVGGITCPPEVPDEFADELRELGVEVDR